MKRILIVSLLLASAGSAAVAQDARHTDLAAIDRAVQSFTGAAIGAPGGAMQPVDRRLKLAACQSSLSLAWHGRRQDTVRVECPDPRSWRIFVALTAGHAAKPEEAPAWVERGDMVTIAVSGTGFSVQQVGKALETGSEGDWIRVLPNGAETPVRARIQRPGLVEIPLG